MLRKESPPSLSNPAYCTRTFVVLATTIERRDDADPPPGRAAAPSRHGRHGRRIPRTADRLGGHRLTREDWLGLLLDREATARDNKRLARRLVQARLRQ